MTESTAQLVTITPEEAARILELENVNNRKMRKTHVARLAEAMKAGHWVVNGETIIYNDNYLLDGQHRLAACVLANAPFTTWVVRNVPSEAMPSIDKGVSRRLSDTLAWAGQSNASQAAAIVRRLWALCERKNLRSAESLHEVDDFVFLEFAEQHSDVVQFAALAGKTVSKNVGLSRTTWGTALGWIALCGNDKDVVRSFVETLAEGAGLAAGDPRWAVREWASLAVRKRRKMRSDEALIAIVKAWNAWVVGDQIKVLKVLPTEQLPEVVVA